MTVLATVFTGFLFFFITDVALALGRSGSLPVILAAWAPAGISGLAGLSMLLHFEDG
jgi:lipopolysaccharide export system permease protein